MRLFLAGNFSAFALLLMIGFFGSATVVAAGLPCTNPAPATQAQVDASNGGFTLGQMVCPNDLKNTGITNDAGAAKAYLLSIAKDLRGSAAPPDKAHIDPLNNSFAVCAANFLKAYIQKYGPVNVVSAFRCGPNSPSNISCNRRENGNAGGATNSNHQLGVAMDINPAGGNSSYDTLKSFAQANSGYGVTFPQPFYNGSIDKNHMQATAPRNPSCTGVSGTPVTPGGGAPFDQSLRSLLGQGQLNASQCITSVSPLVIAPAGTVQQSQCLTNASGQQLSAPPPPPMQQPMQPIQPITQPTPTQTQTTSQQTPPSINTLNSTPYPAGTCSPQTYCSQSDGNIYYRATTCVDQKYQTCANGCTGLICNASSTSATNSQLSGLLSPAVTNDNTNSNSNSTATSSFDLISYFANNPITATNIGTATPIDITNAIENTGNASTLQPSATSGQPIIQTPPQGSYGPVPQQTFTSDNLANSPVYGQQPSTFQAALANMKATLLGILYYLQPFGGQMPGSVPPGSAYAE